MTPSEHKAERDKQLKEAGKAIADKLPGMWGEVRIVLQNGEPKGISVTETVKY
jgi:hypothetical protein